MIKNKFHFISKFKKVIDIDILHNYFDDNILKNIEIVPKSSSLSLMRNYGLIFKRKKEGFVIISENKERFKSSIFNDNIQLIFYLYFNDNFFINYTDIPYDTNGLLRFTNDYGKKLHINEFADYKCFENHDDKLFASIRLDIDESYGFFGDMESQKKINYVLSFNSREVILRYNLVTKTNNISTYYVTDEDNSFKENNFNVRTLASGKSVYFLKMTNKVILSETYNYRHFLKKEDEFFKSFSIPIPHPNIQNISFDVRSSSYCADIYINLD